MGLTLDQISESSVLAVMRTMEDDINISSLASRLQVVLCLCPVDALECAQRLLGENHGPDKWPYKLSVPAREPIRRSTSPFEDANGETIFFSNEPYPESRGDVEYDLALAEEDVDLDYDQELESDSDRSTTERWAEAEQSLRAIYDRQQQKLQEKALKRACGSDVDSKLLSEPCAQIIGFSVPRLALHMDMSEEEWNSLVTKEKGVHAAWAYFDHHCLTPSLQDSAAKQVERVNSRSAKFTAVMRILRRGESANNRKYSKQDPSEPPPDSWTQYDHHAYFLCRVFHEQVRSSRGLLATRPGSNDAKYQMIYLTLKLLIRQAIAAYHAKESKRVRGTLNNGALAASDQDEQKVAVKGKEMADEQDKDTV